MPTVDKSCEFLRWSRAKPKKQVQKIDNTSRGVMVVVKTFLTF